MENSTVISLANTADAQEILYLQKLAFTSEAELHQNYSLPPMIQSLDSLISDFEIYTFFKATIQDSIIGSVKAKMEKETCIISRLVVHPDFENRGIGKLLMHRVEECFGFAIRFELFTGKKSKKNISFYEKLGYKIFGESSHPGNIALVIMEKLKSNKIE